jgi:hypothetical protein
MPESSAADRSTPVAPLATPQDALESKYGWLVAANSWEVLHYVEGVTDETWLEWWDDEALTHKRTAACGRTMVMDLPGVFARMGRPRCRQCCKRLGIDFGGGAPCNHRIGNSGDDDVTRAEVGNKLPAPPVTSGSPSTTARSCPTVPSQAAQFPRLRCLPPPRSPHDDLTR